MSDQELSREQRLAVREEVESRLLKIAALFGIANVAIAGAAIFSMWQYFSSSARVAVSDEVKEITAEYNKTLNEARELIGRLKTRSDDMVELDQEIKKIQGDLAVLSDENEVSAAADFINDLKENPSLPELISRVVSLEGRHTVLITGSPTCHEPRIVSGKATRTNALWDSYGGANGMSIIIDTSAGSFNEVPQYFVSIDGNHHWTVTGINSIYKPTSTGFELYLRWPGSSSLLATAIKDDWYVNWVAIGC